MIEVITAIQVINALLTLGGNGVIQAQKIGLVLEKAQKEGRNITQAEWDQLTDEADAADVKLAMAIANHPD